jgi:DNA-binding MarR family transcriptional regulator/GNAT superfamily N-acetyltransferase
MPTEPDLGQIDAIRAFNRFYTAKIGVLEEGLLESPYSLTEARVLYELAHREGLTATDLGRDLGLDPGYLSRLLKKFESQGLLARHRSHKDGRQQMLALTEAGRARFAPLEEKSRAEVADLLRPLATADRARLDAAMKTIRHLLDPGQSAGDAVIRLYQPGDLGWIIHRQTRLYTQEFGWDGSFEAMLAEIAARFIATVQPSKEACWVAERAGEILGSVMLVEHSPGVAQLRILYVEAFARGLGLGARLVETCDDFARAAGYSKIILWTNSILLPARRLYEAAGYRLIESEAHESFGQKLIGETWEKRL